MITWLTPTENAAIIRDVFMDMIELLHHFPIEEVIGAD